MAASHAKGALPRLFKVLLSKILLGKILLEDAMTTNGYAGDLTPEQAWAKLQEQPNAVLLDCRTTPEWQFVGVPALDQAGKEPMLLEWQVYPDMAVRGNFATQVAEAGVAKDATVAVLCRSGVRSIAAAQALTAAGYSQAFNILDGFEGQLDAQGHRGAGGSGWKASNLPWRQ
jgi:rhodanese-related sulfurtransferase